ncbi:hypothetical protein HanIR_Chr11g0518101 [Helianthus annuus]|nr:hypothetical protein HanIR_Chr11g0518101 [Helianthus annuus]
MMKKQVRGKRSRSFSWIPDLTRALLTRNRNATNIGQSLGVVLIDKMMKKQVRVD